MSDLNQQQKEALGRMMVEGFKNNDAEIIAGCLRRGADPDVSVQDGDSGAKRPVLHWGAYHFNEKGLQAMLDHGANIEARDADGNTALVYAITNFKEEAVEFLMKHGADPLAQNRHGTVALDIARGLRTDYASYEKARGRILKMLTNDYGQLPATSPEKSEPETPKPPVSFEKKPGPNKFIV